MGEIIRRNLDDQFANDCAYSEVVAAGGLSISEFLRG